MWSCGDGRPASAPDGRAPPRHRYLNWASPDGETLPWAELHRLVCAGAAASWAPFAAEGVDLLVGEWSLATNHDAPLEIEDPATAGELRALFLEQLEVFGSDPAVRGAFFWTLRMGSGWDPRPSDGAPRGRQREGSSAWRSLPSYPYRVWSLLEMAAAGIATPLNRTATGSCG